MSDHVSTYGRSDDQEVFCPCCFSSPEQLPAGLPVLRRGTCPWCGERNQPLYPMYAIVEQFRELIALYPVAQCFDDEPNEPLFRRIYHDWDLFNERLACSDVFPDFIQALIRSGLDNDEAIGQAEARELVKPIEYALLDHFMDVFGDSLFDGPFWERFLDPHGPSVSWYDAFIEDMLKTVPAETALYRARIWDKNIHGARFSRRDLSAPPTERISPARANRSCQRTLYCASEFETAIAEIRPYRGATVAVSTLRLSKPVLLVDFSSSVSIGTALRSDNIGWRIQTKALIDHISELFSLPANPQCSELYYAPTQSLCDSLRAQRISGLPIDGIVYRSSLGDGVNYAFFDPDVALPEDPEFRKIEAISILHSDMFDIHTEHPYRHQFQRNHS